MNRQKTIIDEVPVERPARKQFVIKRKNYITYEPIPQKREVQNQLADDMIIWAHKNEEIVDLDQFPLSQKLSPFRFYKIANKNDYFKEALEVAQYIISARLKKAWFEKPFNGRYCAEMLPEYNKAYRELITMKVTAAIEARSNHKDASNFTVILDTIASSDKVPERKIDELRDTDPIK